MQATDTGKATVPVGRYDGDGVFLGDMLRFTGEEIGSYTDHSAARSRDDRGTTYTLYRCPQGYRVHVHEWSRWQGEDAESWLWPTDDDGEPYAAEESDARQAFPFLFAALGMPDVYDLD